MPTRIPTPQDFHSLSPDLKISLVPPSPVESTTSILILFHGLGDSEVPFASFARNLALPGVMGISVRGTGVVPAALLSLDEFGSSGAPSGASQGKGYFHWGDDLTLSDTSPDGLEPDPGFSKARDLILTRLIRDVLVKTCGWDTHDILLFGFGQGGSLALGLASWIRTPTSRIIDLETKQSEEGRVFKGAISVGGPLPASMVPGTTGTGSGGLEKARTPVLVCHGRESEAVDQDAVEGLRKEFLDVRVVEWTKADDGMPRNRDEVLPLMQFFAERLRGW